MRLIYFTFLIFGGCVYSFTGFEKAKYSKVTLTVFKNMTVKSGLEDVFYNTISSAFSSDPRFTLTSRKNAQIIIEGEILNYERIPFTYDEQGNIKEYKLTCKIKIILVDSKQREILNKDFIIWIKYPSTETEERGIQLLGKEISRKLIEIILGL